MARQGLTFCSLNVRANQLGAQHDTAFDDSGILRGKRAASSNAASASSKRPAASLGRPARQPLSVFGIGAHHWGLKLR